MLLYLGIQVCIKFHHLCKIRRKLLRIICVFLVKTLFSIAFTLIQNCNFSRSSAGAAGDSSKFSEMSVDEKRQLVYSLSKQSDLASEVLQAWTRQEILQILCAELGKERKYTGLTKIKIIETLLKIVSEKKSGDNEGKKRDSDCSPVQRNSKRQRKVDNPSRYVTPTSNNASGSSNSVNTKGN